jgi:N,N'-diacetyllegionaminate synthase
MTRAKFSQTFSLLGREVGEGCPVFIVAEAGVAHFGSLEKAFSLVDLAADARADAVKFQVFKTDEMISRESEEWRDRMRPKELPYEAFREVQSYCRERSIIFFATAHDEPSLDFLDTLGVSLYKIGSGEVGNWPFLRKVASRRKPVILSTGMYTLEQVGEALQVMAEVGTRDVAVLHCVTRYPTQPSEVNLRAVDTIRDTYGVMTGYSDHTRGFHLPLAAVARGACIIEKHITLDFDVPNAHDWKVSCGPDDLHVMVRQIREIEAGLGSGVKALSEAEQESLRWARKSLVAAVDMLPGELITREKLCAKRPGTGIVPADIERVLGKVVRAKIEADTLLQWEHLA